LRRVERKVLDPQAEVIHDQPRAARHATRQTAKTPLTVVPHRIPPTPFANTPPHKFVRVAVSRQRHRCAPPHGAGLAGLHTARAADGGARLLSARVRLEAR
jgi:hypothetical protein